MAAASDASRVRTTIAGKHGGRQRRTQAALACPSRAWLRRLRGCCVFNHPTYGLAARVIASDAGFMCPPTRRRRSGNPPRHATSTRPRPTPPPALGPRARTGEYARRIHLRQTAKFIAVYSRWPLSGWPPRRVSPVTASSQVSEGVRSKRLYGMSGKICSSVKLRPRGWPDSTIRSLRRSSRPLATRIPVVHAFLPALRNSTISGAMGSRPILGHRDLLRSAKRHSPRRIYRAGREADRATLRSHAPSCAPGNMVNCT